MHWVGRTEANSCAKAENTLHSAMTMKLSLPVSQPVPWAPQQADADAWGLELSYVQSTWSMSEVCLPLQQPGRTDLSNCFFLPGPILCKGSTGPGDVVCLQHALKIPHQTTQPSEDTGSSILTDSLNGLKASQQQVKQYQVSMLYKEKKIIILLRWNKAEVPPALAAHLSRYIICGDIHF